MFAFDDNDLSMLVVISDLLAVKLSAKQRAFVKEMSDARKGRELTTEEMIKLRKMHQAKSDLVQELYRMREKARTTIFLEERGLKRKENELAIRISQVRQERKREERKRAEEEARGALPTKSPFGI
jgi:hypothetical protein